MPTKTKFSSSDTLQPLLLLHFSIQDKIELELGEKFRAKAYLKFDKFKPGKSLVRANTDFEQSLIAGLS